MEDLERSPHANLPGLAVLRFVVLWVHEAAMILAAPFLTAGVLIVGADVMLGGGLTTQAPILGVVWALALVLGLDTVGYSIWTRVAASHRFKSWGGLAGWSTLGLVVGLATAQVVAIYVLQHVQHVSDVAAMAEIGLTPKAWAIERAVLVPAMGAIIALTHLVPRAKDHRPLSERRAELEEQIALAPLLAERDRLASERAARSVEGGVGVLRAGAKALFAKDDEGEAEVEGRKPGRPTGVTEGVTKARLAQAKALLRDDPDLKAGDLRRRMGLANPGTATVLLLQAQRDLALERATSR